ncbi:UL36 very large tegument protein [Streptomyces sp. NPDC086023]|uniref:UL36 very large tegument protein n=1 Tax=Streptomyces sp. NPDC086023 TaxID=3365746 RepID=UPI0037CF59E5
MRELVALLDPGTGWYAEFLRRDPEGMRACLDGAAVAPWDVLASLLADLAAVRGEESARAWTAEAARLRAAAVAAYDRRPGGAGELRDQLADAEAQRAAAEAALRTLADRLRAAPPPAEAERLTRELSWTRDDHARAASRCTDLATRLTAVPPAWPESDVFTPRSGAAGPHAGTPGDPPGPDASTPGDPAAPDPEGHASGERRPEAAGPAFGRWFRTGRQAGTPGGKVPRQRGARFAGAPVGTDAGPAPTPFPAGMAAAPAPRGARFGGAPEEPVPEPLPGPEGTDTETGRTVSLPARQAVAELVGELIGLRTQGRSGEAHGVLCEAAGWPPERLPALAGELERAGLAADWATLLWEAASLPPTRLAAAAAALSAAGRAADCVQLLRQGVSRPAAEIADAALALAADGRDQEAGALLGAFVRVRAPEEAARLARTDPPRLAPRLLAAARAVSDSRHRDLVHALRVAGVPLR